VQEAWISTDFDPSPEDQPRRIDVSCADKKGGVAIFHITPPDELVAAVVLCVQVHRRKTMTMFAMLQLVFLQLLETGNDSLVANPDVRTQTIPTGSKPLDQSSFTPTDLFTFNYQQR